MQPPMKKLFLIILLALAAALSAAAQDAKVRSFEAAPDRKSVV